MSPILPFHEGGLNHNFRHNLVEKLFKNLSSIKTIMNIFAAAQSQVLKETKVDLKKLKRMNYLLPPTPCLLKIKYSKKILYVSGWHLSISCSSLCCHTSMFVSLSLSF